MKRLSVLFLPYRKLYNFLSAPKIRLKLLMNAIFLSVLFLSSCTKLKYLPQLLTLKDLANEQEQLNQHVEEADKKFQNLLQAIKTDTIRVYANQKGIIEAFGDPVLIEDVVGHTKASVEWMYRYSTQFFTSEKVYLYFDSSKNLIEWEYVPGKG